jgi:hypothetical protein
VNFWRNGGGQEDSAGVHIPTLPIVNGHVTNSQDDKGDKGAHLGAIFVDGHLQIEPRLATMIAVGIMVGGMALGMLGGQLMPFQNKSDAQNEQKLIEEELEAMRAISALRDNRLQDLEKWRSSTSEVLGKIEAEQEETLRQLMLLQQRNDRR